MRPVVGSLRPQELRRNIEAVVSCGVLRGSLGGAAICAAYSCQTADLDVSFGAASMLSNGLRTLIAGRVDVFDFEPDSKSPQVSH